MKSYIYSTNDKRIATVFARVAAAFLDRPHDPNAMPLNFDTGPFEFHCGVIGNEPYEDDTAKIFEQFAKALRMEVNIVHHENPPKHEPPT